MRASFKDRFWAKVDRRDEAGCWPWTGGKSSGGYGSIRAERAPWPMLKAHRVAYEMVNGEIPAGMVIDHLCMNKGCVNPAHLEVVTSKENSGRYSRARTHCVRGHELTPETEGVRPGTRSCRICHRANYRRWYEEGGGKEHRRQQRGKLVCVFEGIGS